MRDDIDWTETTTKVVEAYAGHVNPGNRGWQTIKCLSPDHEDKHGSARVNLPAGAYHCNGCGVSTGSLVELVRMLDGTDRESALSKLAQIAGDDMPAVPRKSSRTRGGIPPGVLDEPWAVREGNPAFPPWMG